MRSGKATIALLVSITALVVSVSVASGTEDKAAGSGGIVLDTKSYWRCHVTLRPPVYGTASAPRPLAEALDTKELQRRGKRLPADQPHSSLPPANWMQPDFDDNAWWRDPGPFFGGGPHRGNQYWYPSPHQERYGTLQPTGLALLCVRGKFRVTEPSQVEVLKLSVEFRGGLVVYLNGKEVGRSYMRKGRIDFGTPAEDYPEGAFIIPKLKRPRHISEDEYRRLREKHKETERTHYEMRVRRLQELALPVAQLRKGVNVLALEIHRTVLHPAFDRRYAAAWSTVGLLDIQLKASGSGVESNVARPKGLQVWNANPLESVFPSDYGNPCEPLCPIRMVGARGGVFSGQVVVGCDEGIKGLTAQMSKLELKAGAGIIPAVGVQVRYVVSWDAEDAPKTVRRWQKGRGVRLLRFGALAASPSVKVLRFWRFQPYTPAVLGKTQPIWITVRVPAGAAPGQYEGKLTIRTEQAEPISVPVALEVHDFCLPDPKDYRTWVDFIESPDSVALAYKVPLWSEEHFELMGKTFALLGQVGNKTLYIPLICRTNLGNSQSMVRWIREADGSFRHDFSIMERYLDLAEKHGMKPQVVCLQVWDFHIDVEPGVSWGVGGGIPWEEKRTGKGREPKPVPVTLLDPLTGEVGEMTGPKYVDPEARGFWEPVIKGIQERLQKRGWERAMALGISNDSIPRQETVRFWNELLPYTGWVGMSHYGQQQLHGVPFTYRVVILGWKPAADPAVKRRHGWEDAPLGERVDRWDVKHTPGWKNPQVAAYLSRFQRTPAPAWNRLLCERAIQGNVRGAGRMGADFSPVRGGRSLEGRYPETSWGNLHMTQSWLPPGPEGALSSVVFEMAREGIQECEVRIFIEKTLLDEKSRSRLGDALAQACQALLDERTRYIAWADESAQNALRFSFLPGGSLGYDWYAGSGWQERSGKLFATAAKVAQVLKK